MDFDEFQQVNKGIRDRATAIDLNTDRYFVIANKMIRGTTNLTLNEKKLLKLIIMQIEPSDEEFMTYKIKVKELAKLLGICSNNLYRRKKDEDGDLVAVLDEMTDHIMDEKIKMEKPNSRSFKKFRWVDYCEYDEDTNEIIIRLSNELRPYLLNLKEHYTQIRLFEELGMKSNFSMDIYDMIMMCLGEKYQGDEHKIMNTECKRTVVHIDIKTLRRATNTENKYKQGGQFKSSVVDVAVNEINQKTPYHIEVQVEKEGNAFVGFYFIVETDAVWRVRTRAERMEQAAKDLEETIEGQTNIFDFIDQE